MEKSNIGFDKGTSFNELMEENGLDKEMEAVGIPFKPRFETIEEFDAFFNDKDSALKL